MARGDLDLSAVSSIEYARNPDRYYIIPDLSISCRGAVKSVLLLSRVPMEHLSNQQILLSAQSHTSVALLRILLASRLGIDGRFIPGNCTEALAGENPPTAFLAIGDEALRLRDHPLYPYRWDLGQEWLDWTGLPFVFALWVVRREAAMQCSARMNGAVETLMSAKWWGSAHLGEVCAIAAEQKILGPVELLDYYRGLEFNLGEEQLKGLELFFKHLVKIGEIGEAPPLETCPTEGCGWDMSSLGSSAMCG
jgi:chorismate dehydratase